MNKKEFIKSVSKKSTCTEEQVTEVVNLFLDEIQEAITNGTPVSLRKLFTIKPAKRAAKPVNNIRKGIKMTMPARVVPVCKFSTELKQAVNEHAKLSK